MDHLDLHTSVNTPGINSVHIDGNFTSIEERVNFLLDQEAEGTRPVTITADADGLMTMTLSNGTVLGPIQLPRAPLSLKDEWMAGGVHYLVGDVVTQDGSSYGCKVEHDSHATDFAVDLLAGKWQLLAAKGEAGATALDRQCFNIIGSAAVAARYLAAYIVPNDCELTAAIPIVVGLLNAITSGSSIVVTIQKVTAIGYATTIGTVTLGVGDRAATAAIDETFAAGDALVFSQGASTGATGAANVTMTAVLTPTV